MPVDVSYEGRVYPPTEPYAVGREAIREFAAAVGASSPLHHDVAAARAAGYPDVVAPPTYAVVLAQRAESQYVADPAAGVDFTRVVHAEEQFDYQRPLVAGQEVAATLLVQRVREVGGNAMITTRVDLADKDGAIGHVVSTLVVRAEES